MAIRKRSPKRKTSGGSKPKPRPQPRKPNKAALDALVEIATTDTHDEDEQVTGFFTMLENHLELPFETEVLGVTVEVVKTELRGSRGGSPVKGVSWRTKGVPRLPPEDCRSYQVSGTASHGFVSPEPPRCAPCLNTALPPLVNDPQSHQDPI